MLGGALGALAGGLDDEKHVRHGRFLVGKVGVSAGRERALRPAGNRQITLFAARRTGSRQPSWKMVSMGWPNTRAMAKASGRLGS
ncbi:hypothetical protein MyNCGM152_06460 [Achromobacter xylosoxidans]